MNGSRETRTAATHLCECPTCPPTSRTRFHRIDAVQFAQFGRDCQCIPCVDREHIEFMRTTGARLGLRCVPGCRCGQGGAA